MDTIDLSTWVKSGAPSMSPAFRQAIHVLIHAISNSPVLHEKMTLHGGLLLSIIFRGIRHTQDIDFVTTDHINDFDIDSFVKQLDDSLVESCEALPYGMDCRIQSRRLEPPGPDKNFQSLAMTMGYAQKGTNGHKRLMKGQGPNVIEIDFNFNEHNLQVDTVQLSDGGQVRVYSLADQVAEKYRAMIQQKVRNRSRRQDAYDIYSLLDKGFLNAGDIKNVILNSLLLKAGSRELIVDQYSLQDKDVIARSAREYTTLADEISGELPPFDKMFEVVRTFYESLPWNCISGDIRK